MRRYEALLFAAQVGLIVALLEIHAAFVTTGRFDLPASLALLAYNTLGVALVGLLYGLRPFLMKPGRTRADVTGSALGLLLAAVLFARCFVDGVFVVFPGAAMGSMYVTALRIVVPCLVAAGLLHLLLKKPAGRVSGNPLHLGLFLTLSVAALLYSGFFLQQLQSQRTYPDLRFTILALCSCFSAWLAGRWIAGARLHTALWATALIILTPILLRVALGPAELSRIRSSDPPARDRPVSVEQRQNVVLIVLDTVRADHLELYGYHRETMPRLTSFSAQAKVYLNCISNSSWTLPSHASLFTGLYPREHGAHGGSASSDSPGRGAARALSSDHITLAETLQGHGYRTAGIATNILFLTPKWGLDQGFEYWDSRPSFNGALTEGYFPMLLRTLYLVDALPVRRLYDPLAYFDVAQVIYRRAEETTNAAIELIDDFGETDSAPFFLFLNYMDAHYPYQAPRPFDDSFEGRLENTPRFRTGLKRSQLSAEMMRRHLVAQYDSELAYLDHNLGRLLDELQERGLLANTIVAITSDHGEAFFEHSLGYHGGSLYQEEIHVPLIIYEPDAGSDDPHVIDKGVEQKTIMPWLLARLGIDTPGKLAPVSSMENHSRVLAELYGGLSDFAFSPSTRSSRHTDQTTLISPSRMKYIAFSDESTELFDLAADPEEKTNLIETQSETGAELQFELNAFLQEYEPSQSAEPEDLSPEELERLRAIGYIN